ncbi:MAG: replicative DNA helicase [Nostoc sp.]|uniref:replicative DNA helicase n=1 Tax=Nostoc sp. TaxID=1180 RepID=UPI002FFC24F3
MHSVDSNSANHLDFKGIEDKLPPQNIEAEEVILGGILLDPDAMDRVVDTLSPEAFYVSAHKDIYQAAKALHNQNKPIDLLTVTSWLTDNKLLAQVGGRNKLATLVDCTVSAINIDAMATLVVEKYLSRRLIAIGNEIVKLGHDQSRPLAERLDIAEQKIFNICHQVSLNDEPELLGDIGVRVYAQIEALSQGDSQAGIPTGFYDLDSIINGGLHPGQLIIIGARPAMGKSSAACQIAFNISQQGVPTMIFSLEMSKEDIYSRLLGSESGIKISYLKSGNISNSQWEPLARTVAELYGPKLVIDHASCPTPSEIRSKVRKAIAKHGEVKLVVIDYLQLMVDGSDLRIVQKIGEITRQLKLLARECNLTVILLSQLSRGLEARTNKRPILSDLRDSGRIEEDADLVLGLYRDEYYNPETRDRGIAELIILKHRNGPTGTVKLLFDAQFTTFKNLARS